MLLAPHALLLGVKTPDALLHTLRESLADLAFDWLSATLVVDHVAQPSEFFNVSLTPPGYEQIFSDAAFARNDPVMQHLKHSHRPIAWDRHTYAQHGEAPRWRAQADFGLHTGIAAVTHLPGGEHFVVGIDRTRPLPTDPAALADMVARVQLITVCAYEAAAWVLRPPPAPRCEATLSTRERDCLLWTMEGKTAWEIGQILSLSERTVAGHLGSAVRKLECVNKQQAVVKALRLGLLDLRH